jgi:hypothetical protein
MRQNVQRHINWNNQQPDLREDPAHLSLRLSRLSLMVQAAVTIFAVSSATSHATKAQNGTICYPRRYPDKNKGLEDSEKSNLSL